MANFLPDTGMLAVQIDDETAPNRSDPSADSENELTTEWEERCNIGKRPVEPNAAKF